MDEATRMMMVIGLAQGCLETSLEIVRDNHPELIKPMEHAIRECQKATETGPTKPE